MSYFSEEGSQDAVIARLKNCSDPRTRQIMESLIRHLHSFIKDVEPTEAEWFKAIEWLTATGQMCDGKRQEWILTSDVLGVSMLMETINNRTADGRSESTVLGPFHVADSEEKAYGASICLEDHPATDICLVEGQVTDITGKPVEGATIEVWQTNDEGFYDVQQPDIQPEGNMRALFRTDAEGRYRFKTIKPVSYPIPTDGPVGELLNAMGRDAIRPAHIHFWIRHPDHAQLITHIFLAGDTYIESDPVFGVKEELIYNFDAVKPEEADGAHWKVVFDPVLGPPRSGASG